MFLELIQGALWCWWRVWAKALDVEGNRHVLKLMVRSAWIQRVVCKTDSSVAPPRPVTVLRHFVAVSVRYRSSVAFSFVGGTPFLGLGAVRG